MKNIIAIFQNHYQKIILVFCFFISVFIIFTDLHTAPLENWDEAFYGATVKELIQRKDPIVLYFNGSPFLEKPPLQMWLVSLTTKFTGLNEFAIRFPSAVSAIVIIALILFYAYKYYGLIPALVAFCTLVCSDLFIWRARTGNLDALTMLLVLLIFIFISSKNKFRYIILGLLFGLLYLTKLGMMYFPLIIFIAHELIYKHKDFQKNVFEYLKLFCLVLLIPGIWLFLGYREVGIEFINNFLLKSDQGALRLSSQTFRVDYLFYTYYALQRYYLWILFVGLIYALWNIKNNRNFLLICFSTLLIFQLSFIERKNNWYILPSLPFWSLTLAYGISEVLKFFKRKNSVLYIFFGISICLFITVYSYKRWNVNIKPILSSMTSIKEVTSAKIIKNTTSSNTNIVRLDHLYPSTIYYSERHTYISVSDVEMNGGSYVNKQNLIQLVAKDQVQVLVGKSDEVDRVLAMIPGRTYKRVNSTDESIIYLDKVER
ncbi:MAG: glycosyltransferase family 39 protein [Candidatus Roizmanbacteria bacterium]